MAARIQPKLDAKWREKIKTSMLINRLSDFVEGKVEMTPAQVTAALGLLRKNLPDLSASDNTTEVVHNYVARMPQPADTADEWASQHAPTIQ